MSPLAAWERRVVLALAGAAVVWRWLVALRTPLPGVDACGDLWLAARLAEGDFAALLAHGHAWHPWWALVLAPAVALGAPPLLAAQVAAAVLGGLTVVVTAAAAQRLREGAGVPAAVLAALAAGPVVAAGAGSGAALHALLAAVAASAVAAGRWLPGMVLVALAAIGGPDRIAPDAGALTQLRLVLGTAALAAPFALLAPRPPRAGALLAIAALLLALPWIVAVLLAGGAPASAPVAAPVLAALAGVALARLRPRWRELALCTAVAVECHAAWTSIESRHAAAERLVGRYAARQLQDAEDPGRARHAGAAGGGGAERLLSDLPRVRWAAGCDPAETPTGPPAPDAADPFAGVTIAVLGATHAERWLARLPATFGTWTLPPDLADLAIEHGLQCLIRVRR